VLHPAQDARHEGDLHFQIPDPSPTKKSDILYCTVAVSILYRYSTGRYPGYRIQFGYPHPDGYGCLSASLIQYLYKARLMA
jgi:hypothetical protein